MILMFFLWMAMKSMFEIATTNLKLARERGDPKDNSVTQ